MPRTRISVTRNGNVAILTSVSAFTCTSVREVIFGIYATTVAADALVSAWHLDVAIVSSEVDLAGARVGVVGMESWAPSVLAVVQRNLKSGCSSGGFRGFAIGSGKALGTVASVRGVVI